MFVARSCVVSVGTHRHTHILYKSHNAFRYEGKTKLLFALLRIEFISSVIFLLYEKHQKPFPSKPSSSITMLVRFHVYLWKQMAKFHLHSSSQQTFCNANFGCKIRIHSNSEVSITFISTQLSTYIPQADLSHHLYDSFATNHHKSCS